ncbi:molybdopterin-dependent oxidoreductase [Vibrio chagasii]|nr:molybdopterin-dependent oxidoreductase [Vibrio chagasii]
MWFVRISWDEVYKLIHQQLLRIRKEHGAESVFAGSYGWRSGGVFHVKRKRLLLQRYMSIVVVVYSVGDCYSRCCAGHHAARGGVRLKCMNNKRLTQSSLNTVMWWYWGSKPNKYLERSLGGSTDCAGPDSSTS